MDSAKTVEEQIASLIDSIRLYPSTAFVQGRITKEQECKGLAEWMYNELIIDRRILPQDVSKLLDLAQLVRHGALYDWS